MVALQAFDLLASRVSLFFSENAAWFDGTVDDYNADRSLRSEGPALTPFAVCASYSCSVVCDSTYGEHYVVFDDGERRWFDLAKEHADGQLKWLETAGGGWPQGEAASRRRKPPVSYETGSSTEHSRSLRRALAIEKGAQQQLGPSVPDHGRARPQVLQRLLVAGWGVVGQQAVDSCTISPPSFDREVGEAVEADDGPELLEVQRRRPSVPREAGSDEVEVEVEFEGSDEGEDELAARNELRWDAQPGTDDVGDKGDEVEAELDEEDVGHDKANATGASTEHSR